MPKELDNYTILFGTSKDKSARLFNALMNKDARTFDIDKKVTDYVEPTDDNPLVPARSKSDIVIKRYERAEDEKIAVLTADVVFVKEGEARHKEMRNEGFESTNGATQILGLLETVSRTETESWYCLQAFTVQWLIALTLQTDDGHKVETKFTIKGQYHSPLAFDVVQQSYNPHMNTRIPLVEQWNQVATNFYWVTDAGEELPMSPELAEQLIVQRVLPAELFGQMIDAMSLEVEDDVWQYVALDYRQFLQQLVEVV